MPVVCRLLSDMRLRHFIIFVVVAAALGVATVWYHVRIYALGYELKDAADRKEQLKKDIDNSEVELLQLTRQENLEALNRKYDLGLEPPD